MENGLHPAVVLGPETVEDMQLVVVGRWTLGEAEYQGEIVAQFKADRTQLVHFCGVSSFIMIEEKLALPVEFIFTSKVDVRAGLFECFGSSYLQRIRCNDRSIDFFKDHRHFVLFNENYLSHITCEEMRMP